MRWRGSVLDGVLAAEDGEVEDGFDAGLGVVAAGHEIPFMRQQRFAGSDCFNAPFAGADLRLLKQLLHDGQTVLLMLTKSDTVVDLSEGAQSLKSAVMRIADAEEQAREMLRIGRRAAVPVGGAAEGALPLADGEAIAWTEMARGLLVHWVRLEDSPSGPRVADCRVLAPTEWNFHPRGVLAQACITWRKALSMRTSQPGVRMKRRSVLRSECDSLNSATGSTMRGSGAHHSGGSPGLYQGKMPRW